MTLGMNRSDMEVDKKSMESIFASVKNTSVPLTLQPPPPPPGRQDWGNSSIPSPAATMSQPCIGEVLGFLGAHSLSGSWLLCPFARPWSLSMCPCLCLSFCVCVCVCACVWVWAFVCFCCVVSVSQLCISECPSLCPCLWCLVSVSLFLSHSQPVIVSPLVQGGVGSPCSLG